MADLRLYRDLAARAVLSAPADSKQVRTLNWVILFVSVLSILGAGWIALSFCLFKQVRTFRHQLILGLAISDFWMVVNFLSSCAVNLSGNLLSEPPQKTFCSFNGFMTQLFVVQTDYWVLTIAVCTFLILANYKHMSTWVQEHRLIIWSLPWFLSALWAALGVAIAGYGDIGAWCWFTSDKVRLFVNFIPRWLIIILIIFLYARLYHLIYTAHNRFMSFNDDAVISHSATLPHISSTFEPETDSVSSTRRIGHPSSPLHLSDKSHPISNSPNTSNNSANPGGTTGRTHHRGPSPVLKKMAYQMMLYPVVYMLIWTIPTTIRIYQAATGKAAPFGIATVDKACIVIQGFADAVIYGFNETSLAVWRERFARTPRKQAVVLAESEGIQVQRDFVVERSVRSPLPRGEVS